MHCSQSRGSLRAEPVKKLAYDMGCLPTSYWGVLDTPKITQVIAIDLDCTPEPNNKTLLLTISHTWVRRLRNQAETGLKTSLPTPCWLVSFRSTRRCFAGHCRQEGRGNLSMVLPRRAPTDLLLGVPTGTSGTKSMG